MNPPRSRLDWYNDAKAQVLSSEKAPYPISDAEKVYLVTECPKDGWMEARLQIGRDVFSVTFSDVYPPFIEFHHMIEALASDVPPQPVSAYDEVEDQYFHAIPTDQPGVVILEYIRGSYAGRGIYRCAFVSKDQLIHEIYLVLRSLNNLWFNDGDIDPYHNEIDSNLLDERINFTFYYDRECVHKFDLSRVEKYLNEKGLLAELQKIERFLPTIPTPVISLLDQTGEHVFSGRSFSLWPDGTLEHVARDFRQSRKGSPLTEEMQKDMKGHSWASVISVQNFNYLVDLFLGADFFNREDPPNPLILDVGSYQLTFRHNGRERTIQAYDHKDESGLRPLFDELVRIANEAEIFEV